MILDFSSLEKALKTLKKAIDRLATSPGDEEVRDAVIQRFEYSYELSWKMLKRIIEKESANPAAIDQLSFKDLLREAGEKGLISEVGKWMIFREQRNITSHGYDQKKAESVSKTAIEFYAEAIELLKELQSRNHD